MKDVDSSVDILTEMILTACLGFPSLERPKKYQHFMRLIEFILLKSSHSHLLTYPPSDENVYQENFLLTSPSKADSTIPFMDDSRLVVDAASGHNVGGKHTVDMADVFFYTLPA